MKKLTGFCLLILMIYGCNTVEAIKDFFVDPDVEPIEETLIRSLPLAFAAQVSQRTVTGLTPDFVTVTSPCNSFPCTSVIKFKVADTGFPWYQLPGNTTVTVAGLWTSPEQGLLSLLYSINTVGAIKLIEVRTFPVQQNLDGNLMIATSRIDINAGTGPLLSVEVSQQEFNLEFGRFLNLTSLDSLIEVTEEVWMIEINDNASVGYLDDVYLMTGAGQFVSVAGEEVVALQVAALNIEVSASCLTNPTNGDVLINMAGSNPGSAQVGMAQLEFTGNCSATVKVNIATGSYIGAFGKNIPFNLLD